jgi:S1-C subfamily serine protease
MFRSWMIAAAAAAVLAMPTAPAGAAEGPGAPNDVTKSRELEEAREALAEAARRLAELSVQHADRMLGSFEFEQIPPVTVRLGVQLGNGEGRPDGVEIVWVEPGGPAEQAGLRPGDLLLQIDGRSLAGEESALRRVRDVLREAQPGDAASVMYRRGDATQQATVTLESAPPRGRLFRFGIGDGPRHVIRVPELHGMESLMAGPWSDLELVRVSEDLGRYFDTDSGLLVVRAPENNLLQLTAGDVILNIGGREPQSPTHAVRILRSYGPGETIAIEIMRERRRQTIEAVIPEPRRQTWIDHSGGRSHARPQVWMLGR